MSVITTFVLQWLARVEHVIHILLGIYDLLEKHITQKFPENAPFRRNSSGATLVELLRKEKRGSLTG